MTVLVVWTADFGYGCWALKSDRKGVWQSLRMKKVLRMSARVRWSLRLLV